MTETKRYQCRHIFTDGRRCGSPSLRHEEFCYYHHTTRKPAALPRQHTATLDLPMPEDRSAIQYAIGQILSAIAANSIDSRRAGLLLYGLQIASANLPRQNPQQTQPPQVEEITSHPDLGLLAPPAEYDEDTATGRPRSIMRQLLEEFALGKPGKEEEESTTNPGVPEPARSLPKQPALSLSKEPAFEGEGQSTILPTLQATVETAAKQPPHKSRPESVLKGLPFEGCGKIRCFEGARFQPRRRRLNFNVALATEGIFSAQTDFSASAKGIFVSLNEPLADRQPESARHPA